MLNDQQLDAVMESVTDARAYGQATMVYTEDRIRHVTYMSLSTDVVEDLINALRAERQAHQATKAELEAADLLRDAVEQHIWPGAPNSRQRMIHALNAYDTARAGKGDSDE